jgi:hypothetical protein
MRAAAEAQRGEAPREPQQDDGLSADQASEFSSTYKLSPFTARWSEREIVAWIDRVKDGFEGKKRRR